MLTLEDRERGKKRLLWFGVFNSLSFTLLTGNLISLYLLRLDANNGLIGVIASFSYAAFFMLFVGRTLVPRVGVMRLFGWAWLIRYVTFLPVLVAPVFLLTGRTTLVFVLVGGGVLGFHLSRGIGIVANAPMFSGFSDQTDRGRLLSQFQMIASVVSIVIGILVAYLLGEEAGIGRYTLFLGAGVGFGVIATGIVFSLPELEDERDSARRPLLPMIRDLRERPEVRRFFGTFLLIAIASGIGRSFLIVWAKQVHGFSDRLAFFMVAIGSIGNFLAGYLGSVLLDRLGARPLLLFSILAYIVSTIAAILIPPVGGVAVTIAIGIVFFLGTLGFSGNENSSQAYFYGITDPDDRLNLGILFFLILGVGGTVGTVTAGFVLDALITGIGTVWAFRVFFMLTAIIAVFSLRRAGRLASLGAETFRGTLEVIFSFRDLRTVGLLNRLERTSDPATEQNAIRSLAHSGSPIAVADVIDRLSSPSYAIRQEALEALATLPYTTEVESALIRHLREAIHTTAFLAVRILGLRGTREAIAPVRAVIDSEDVLLADRALVALARLTGREAIDDLRQVFEGTTNPRRLMHAAVAIQIAGERQDLWILLRRLSVADLPDYVIDEILLASARILGMYDWFYPRYSRYVRHGESDSSLADDLAAMAPPEIVAALDVLFNRPDPPAIRAAGTSILPLLDPELRDIAASLPLRGRTVFFLISLVLWERSQTEQKD